MCLALRADPEKFVNLMMVDELGLDKWDPQDLKGMWKQGAVTMCSFWFFGGVPVITYAWSVPPVSTHKT